MIHFKRLKNIVGNVDQDYWATGYSFYYEALPMIEREIKNIKKQFGQIAWIEHD